MIFEQIEGLLKAANITYSIHDHEPVTTIDDAEQKVPHLTQNLLKTVVFQIKDGGWILAAVSRRARIDYKQLADGLGLNRKDLRSVSPESIQASIGFEVGGVGPFPVREDITVVIDEKLQETGQVLCGGGRCDRSVEISLDDLKQVSQAQVFPISKD